MDELPETGPETLRRLCLHLVRFMSATTMDPHLYFETRYAAEIAGLQSRDELVRYLRQLVGWVEALELRDRQLRQLDDSLAADGLPPWAAVRAE
jgi:hypothetical protein